MENNDCRGRKANNDPQRAGGAGPMWQREAPLRPGAASPLRVCLRLRAMVCGAFAEAQRRFAWPHRHGANPDPDLLRDENALTQYTIEG
jgi:hypothetical protein